MCSKRVQPFDNWPQSASNFASKAHNTFWMNPEQVQPIEQREQLGKRKKSNVKRWACDSTLGNPEKN